MKEHAVESCARTMLMEEQVSREGMDSSQRLSCRGSQRQETRTISYRGNL